MQSDRIKKDPSTSPAARTRLVILTRGTFHQHLGNAHGGITVEIWQQAVNRVENLVTGNATGQRSTNHTAQQLGDMSSVLSWTERNEYFSSRAVPSSRDRSLRQKNTNTGTLLDSLRFLIRDDISCDIQVLVLAKNVRDIVGAKTWPSVKQCIEDDSEIFFRWLVTNLDHQQRSDRFK